MTSGNESTKNPHSEETNPIPPKTSSKDQPLNQSSSLKPSHSTPSSFSIAGTANILKDNPETCLPQSVTLLSPTISTILPPKDSKENDSSFLNFSKSESLPTSVIPSNHPPRDTLYSAASTLDKNLNARKRTPSKVMLEKQKLEQQEKELAKKNQTRMKRKYTKRNSKVIEKDDSLQSKNSRLSLDAKIDESSLSPDENDFICCLCLSDVDYTLLPNNIDTNTPAKCALAPSKTSEDKKEDEKSNTSLVEKTCDRKDMEKDTMGQLDCRNYDPHNALLICETPNCNRVFHQHCHFVPIFVIPRGQWYCLICTYTQHYNHQRLSQASIMPVTYPSLAKSPKKRGRPRKNQSLLKSMPHSSVVAPDNMVLPFLPKDQIYPPVADVIKMASEPVDTKAKSLPYTLSNHLLTTNPPNKELAHKQSDLFLQFERNSVFFKKTLIEQNLSKLWASISQCLFRIRSSENAIRIYTESDRARKDLLTAAENKKCLPAELVLSQHKLLSNKFRIRSLLESLEYYIKFGGVSDNINGRIEPRCDEEDEEQEINDKKESKDAKAAQVLNNGISNQIECKTNNHQIKETNEETNVNKNEEEMVITCSVCFSSEATDTNDILLCDGLGCSRAFHMECLSPKVTSEEIDNDPDDSWFCPYCTSLGKLIYHVQAEYYGDDEDGEKGKEWEVVQDVFKGIYEDMEIWGLGPDGVRKTVEVKKGMVVSRQAVLDLLGLEDDGNANDEEDDEDDEDYLDLKQKTENNCDDEKETESTSSESLNDISSIEGNIDKSEINELSCEESDDTNEENTENKEVCDGNIGKVLPKRRRRRKIVITLPDDTDTDAGKLDERNIVQGKRNRTKVDYRRLNDAMFGQLQENEAKKMFGDEKSDEYHSVSGVSPDPTSNKSGKKRGRPRKTKIEGNEVLRATNVTNASSQALQVVKKKRGRPPKGQASSASISASSPKKRGRPAKVNSVMKPLSLGDVTKIKSKPQNEICQASIQVASSLPSPVKRKRGRPRKIVAENTKLTVSDHFQTTPSTYQFSEQGILKNSGASNESCFTFMKQNPLEKKVGFECDDNIAISSMVKSIVDKKTLNNVPPGKRKRGRPPKLNKKSTSSVIDLDATQEKARNRPLNNAAIKSNNWIIPDISANMGNPAKPAVSSHTTSSDALHCEQIMHLEKKDIGHVDEPIRKNNGESVTL